MVLASIAAATSHVGLVATASTTYNEPYNLARCFASLDMVSRGRAGWNVVTTADAATIIHAVADCAFASASRCICPVALWLTGLPCEDPAAASTGCPPPQSDRSTGGSFG